MALRKKFTEKKVSIRKEEEKKMKMKSKKFHIIDGEKIQVKRVHRFKVRKRLEIFQKRRFRWTDWSIIR